MCLGKELVLAKEENICLNQLAYSMAAAPRLSAREDKTSATPSESFFVYELRFSFAKIPKGGEGGREVRKEIKPHLLRSQRAPANLNF